MYPVEIGIPDWLKARNGALRPLPDNRSFAVQFDGKPLYLIRPIPADGKYACEVIQTNNGKRIANDIVSPTSKQALTAGLEALRQALGW